MKEATCLSCVAKDRTIAKLGAALEELSADFERMAAVTERLVEIQRQKPWAT